MDPRRQTGTCKLCTVERGGGKVEIRRYLSACSAVPIAGIREELPRVNKTGDCASAHEGGNGERTEKKRKREIAVQHWLEMWRVTHRCVDMMG